MRLMVRPAVLSLLLPSYSLGEGHPGTILWGKSRKAVCSDTWSEHPTWSGHFRPGGGGQAHVILGQKRDFSFGASTSLDPSLRSPLPPGTSELGVSPA